PRSRSFTSHNKNAEDRRYGPRRLSSYLGEQSERRTNFYGSFTVSLQEAPQTPALARRGSVVFRQLTLPFPFAFGSRYLKRQFSNDPVSGFCEMVASQIAPCLLSMMFPGPQPAGA